MDPVLELRGVRKEFPGTRSLRPPWARRRLIGVDGVDLTVGRGEIVGLVGESGCGKSTLARCVVGMYEPTAGEVLLHGRPLGAHRAVADRRAVQMVFQDPHAALNPSLKVGEMLEELLRVHRLVPAGSTRDRTDELLFAVGLETGYRDARPKELSGGQRQRVNIARALALEPEIIVADEVVSALDASVQASVLSLLLDLRDEYGMGILFISHNLAVVRQICDRVAVMRAGRLVEQAAGDMLFRHPEHPYTRELLDAVPRLDVPGRG